MPSIMSLLQLIKYFFYKDGTIWYPDMYMLWGGGSPFKVKGDGKSELVDVSNRSVTLLGVSGSILHQLKHDEKWSNTKVAWVSKTDEPEWALECLQKFRTSGGDPIEMSAHSSQIYKGDKQSHFRNLKKEFPDIDFEHMLFFDNEISNIRTVSKLGVKCVYCPDGVTSEAWEQGFAMFR